MMEVLPVAVRSTAGVVGIWSLVVVAVITAIKAWPMLRKMQLDSDSSLRGDLLARIVALEEANERDRVACEERVARMESRYEESLRELKAELQVLRHERNNLKQGFNAMLALLKRPNADVPAVLAAVEEMVARGDEVIAIEKGSMKGMRQ